MRTVPRLPKLLGDEKVVLAFPKQDLLTGGTPSGTVEPPVTDHAYFAVGSEATLVPSGPEAAANVPADTASRDLPDWLTLRDGILTGTPDEPGTHEILLTATTSTGTGTGAGSSRTSSS